MQYIINGQLVNLVIKLTITALESDPTELSNLYNALPSVISYARHFLRVCNEKIQFYVYNFIAGSTCGSNSTLMLVQLGIVEVANIGLYALLFITPIHGLMDSHSHFPVDDEPHVVLAKKYKYYHVTLNSRAKWPVLCDSAH